MSAKPWYRSPLKLIGVALLLLLFLGLASFAWSVWKDVQLERAGVKLPDPIQAAQQESYSKLYASLRVASSTARLETTDEPTLGNPSAKVHIVEFLDYDCPYSRQAAPVIRDFMAQHQTDAFYEVREFPLTDIHPQAEDAAIAARCVYRQGNPNLYWAMYDTLFATQGSHDPASLRADAQSVGANMDAYDACVSSTAPMSDLVNSTQDAIDAGARGTPTFYVNGAEVDGALDADTLDQLYQAAEAK